MAGRGNPRKSDGNARRKLAMRVRAEGRPCHLCDYPIDYSLKYPDRTAFALDEIKPVCRGGSPYRRDNVGPAHSCCNSWRGAKPLTPQLKAAIRARFEREILHHRPAAHAVGRVESTLGL